jgi:hypothetical protein
LSVLVAVTDHAAERFRQRVAGTLDAKAEVIRRVALAWEAGRVEEDRGTYRVRDLRDRSLVFVCRREGAELVVITLWEGRAASLRRASRGDSRTTWTDDPEVRALNLPIQGSTVVESEVQGGRYGLEDATACGRQPNCRFR